MAVLVPMSGLRIGRYCSERCTCPVSRVRCVCRPRYAPHDMAMDMAGAQWDGGRFSFGSLSCETFLSLRSRLRRADFGDHDHRPKS